jgi:hypothetical protein
MTKVVAWRVVVMLKVAVILEEMVTPPLLLLLLLLLRVPSLRRVLRTLGVLWMKLCLVGTRRV